ncbi:MAG: hypothetical protein DRN15_07135 [Thermoprotei archaeon]|nr:MAG: hypothetical protein DRN15_07135 [Thermoprotei archaeon]
MKAGGVPSIDLVDVIDALQRLLAKHRGNSAVFRPKDIAKILDLPQNGYYYGLVNQYLRVLEERGYIEVYKNKKSVKYMITRNSPLWPKVQT